MVSSTKSLKLPDDRDNEQKMSPENEIDLETFYRGLQQDSFTREEVEAMQGRNVVRNVEIADHMIVDGNRGTIFDWERIECEWACAYHYNAKVAWQDGDGNRLRDGALNKADMFTDVRYATEKETSGFPDYETCRRQSEEQQAYADLMQDQETELAANPDTSIVRGPDHDNGGIEH